MLQNTSEQHLDQTKDENCKKHSLSLLVTSTTSSMTHFINIHNMAKWKETHLLCLHTITFRDTETPTQSIKTHTHTCTIQIQWPVFQHIKPSFQPHLVWELWSFMAGRTGSLVKGPGSRGHTHKHLKHIYRPQDSFFPLAPLHKCAHIHFKLELAAAWG